MLMFLHCTQLALICAAASVVVLLLCSIKIKRVYILFIYVCGARGMSVEVRKQKLILSNSVGP